MTNNDKGSFEIYNGTKRPVVIKNTKKEKIVLHPSKSITLSRKDGLDVLEQHKDLTEVVKEKGSENDKKENSSVSKAKEETKEEKKVSKKV